MAVKWEHALLISTDKSLRNRSKAEQGIKENFVLNNHFPDCFLEAKCFVSNKNDLSSFLSQILSILVQTILIREISRENARELNWNLKMVLRLFGNERRTCCIYSGTYLGALSPETFQK